MTSTVGLASETSVEVWNRFFPGIDCELNPCARDIPTPVLEAFLEKASYLASAELSSNTYVFITDLSQNSRLKRGYLLNLQTGGVETFHVAHGSGSGDGKGNAIKFSNLMNSHMSSLGLYVTAETYFGKHGYSLRLDGLEDTNSEARNRDIVIHGANYLTENFIKTYGRAGRSWGCPAVDPSHNERLINLLKGGSLYYIYHNSLN